MTEILGDTTANKRAWDELYRGTPGSVWGSRPIPFVAEFLADIELELPTESRLLDAAAGDGRHVPVLLRAPGVVFACDASPHALKKSPSSMATFSAISAISPRRRLAMIFLISSR